MKKQIIHIELSDDLYRSILELIERDKINHPSISFIVRKSLKEYLDVLSKQK